MEFLLIRLNYRDKPTGELAQKMALLHKEMCQAIERMDDPCLRKDYAHALRRMEVGWEFLGSQTIKVDPPLLRLTRDWSSNF